MKLFLKLSFLGTRYQGYQVQGDRPTVQKILNEVTEHIFGFPCDIVGCSRTDSGVHAEEFCVTVANKGQGRLETTVPAEKVPRALNALLPEDIAVNDAYWVPDEFHPRYDVKYKEYVYRMWNGKVRNPFLADRMFCLPHLATEEDVARMDCAAREFVGTHDFRAFMAQGSKVKDTVRTVFDAAVTSGENSVVFRVAANGFLYNMVRIMAGTLLDVGRGYTAPEEIGNILAGRNRHAAGRTAPAYGLYLHRVSYTDYDFKEEKDGYFPIYR